MRVAVDLAHVVLVGACLVVSGIAAFGSLCIFLPAPHTRYAWWFIVAGEGSIWLLALAVLGIFLSLLAAAVGGGALARLSCALGAAAVVMALVPPFQTAVAAWPESAALTIRPDLFGRRDGPGWTPPQEVTFADVGGKALTLDVYRRQHDPREQAPAIIVVHGGGWTEGSKSEQPLWNIWLVQQGFVVFDVDYRLAPPPTWRAAPSDVKCAVAWVREHAEEYGVDPARIGLLGRSAGAHLALLAAYAPSEHPSSPDCDTPDDGVRAVVSLYGPTDIVRMHDHPVAWPLSDGPAKLRTLVGGDPIESSEEFSLASPVTHVNPQTPPTLIVQGGNDQYVRAEHVDLLRQRLEQAGVPSRAVVFPYARHMFDYVWNGWSAQALRPILLDFLNRHL